METTQKWYTRGGFPLLETTTDTGHPDHLVLGVGNPMQVGDIEITEAAYDILVLQNDIDIQASRDAATSAVEVLKDQVRAKLVAGTPLTADEASRVL